MSKQEVMSVPVLYQAIVKHQDHKKLIVFLVDLLEYVVDATSTFIPCYWDHKRALRLLSPSLQDEDTKQRVNSLLNPPATTIAEAILFLSNEDLDKMSQKDIFNRVLSMAFSHFRFFYPQAILLAHLKRMIQEHLQNLKETIDGDCNAF